MLPLYGAQHVACSVFYGRKIGWSIAFSDTAFIVAKHHVHDPMQPVFYSPVVTDGFGVMFSI